MYKISSYRFSRSFCEDDNECNENIHISVQVTEIKYIMFSKTKKVKFTNIKNDDTRNSKSKSLVFINIGDWVIR